MLLLTAAIPFADARNDPSEFGEMLDHVAIVGQMIRACGHARPDLAEQLSAAQVAWWNRNENVREQLAELRKDAATPSSRALLQHYEATKKKLQQEIAGLDRAGNAAYAANCDGILQKLNDGRLDYTPSTAE